MSVFARSVSIEEHQRIPDLIKDVTGRGGSFIPDFNPFVRDVALYRAVQPGRSRVQIRAGFLYELVKLAPIEIRPEWDLTGEHLLPSADVYWFAFQKEPQDLSRLFELGITEEEVERVQKTVQAWTNQFGPAFPDVWMNAVGEVSETNKLGNGYWGKTSSDQVYWASGWIENHSVRGYEEVLRIGFTGIRQRIETLLMETDINDPDFPQKENFWKAAMMVCDAGILLGKRYADLALEMAARTDDPYEQSRYQSLAEVCARVPAHGARTFFEAVQSLWFAHVLSCGEDYINANSIGRLDQMLFPYYQQDIEAHRLTREEALEIMEELACKLYLDYDVQAITLGGQDKDGNDATNEVSYLILEATRAVGFARDVSVRLHRSSPPEFVRLASELIIRGGGIPFIFNDDCFIPALVEHGIALEDARNYAPIGCIELTIPGKANPHAVSGWFNSLKCLELALFGGIDPQTGEQLGVRTPTLPEYQDFEDLFRAYCQQVEFFANRMVYHCNRGELMQRERGPLPCLSTLTEDCIGRGRDITDGGPVYNYHSICFLGTANTADSLMAIKKLVFDEHLVDAGELLAALKANFSDHELLRQMLLKRAPKYGNDFIEVDAFAQRISEHFIDLMDTMRSPLNGRYFVHLFSFRCNLDFGKSVGATPDGRRAGEPLAYSLSAHQGRDQAGVTALLNSISRMPHQRAAGATAAIVEIDPDLVKDEAGVERLTQIIQGAIAMGVGQIQWNVTTVERLLQAQRDPEHYGNIVVRVAGYSQMFKLVPTELQNHIIARTKHRQS